MGREVIEVDFVEEDGETVTGELPAKFEVCSTCEGRGEHVNRNIDGNGITSSEWAEWDDEEKEAYMRGDYDVTCEQCEGRRVVLVVDRDAIDDGSDEIKKFYQVYCEQKRAEAYDRAEEAYERRMCGGY